jgi:mannose-1-phosphate guanylyltransferase
MFCGAMFATQQEITRFDLGPLAAPAGQLWIVVLAGGDGTRLSGLTAALHGRPLPKQFATLVGEHSLLQQTLLRARTLAPWEHIVVVATAGHAVLAREQTAALGPAAVLVQPANLGTGPGLLLPLAHIRAVSGDARVLVLPSDHHVGQPAVFHQALAELGAGDLAGGLVLLGVEPDAPEPDYGWIVPGRRLSLGPPVLHRVDHFREKPPASLARELMQQGGLWNSFILAADVEAFWQLVERRLPEQTRRFAALGADLTSLRGRRALAQLYPGLPPADFSRSVLAATDDLAVATAPSCGWSDWGTPQRVFDSLAGTPGMEQLRRRLRRQLSSLPPEQVARA